MDTRDDCFRCDEAQRELNVLRGAALDWWGEHQRANRAERDRDVLRAGLEWGIEWIPDYGSKVQDFKVRAKQALASGEGA